MHMIYMIVSYRKVRWWRSPISSWVLDAEFVRPFLGGGEGRKQLVCLMDYHTKEIKGKGMKRSEAKRPV